MRYTERWRAEVEGIDLAGVFIVGERVIVPGARELSAIDRASGEVAWTAPTSRAATLAAGDDVLRVTTRGDVGSGARPRARCSGTPGSCRAWARRHRPW